MYGVDHKWIVDLWESLQRAGPHFGEEVALDDMSDGYRVIVPIVSVLPAGMDKFVREYVRGFAQTHGWEVRRLSLTRWRLLFSVRRG